MKELLDPMMSKKLGVAMVGLYCLTQMSDVTAWHIVAIVCTHTICQTIIDLVRGRKPTE